MMDPQVSQGSFRRTTALVMLGRGGLLLAGGVVAHILRERALAKYNDMVSAAWPSELRPFY
jgi:hypothetical protein